MAGIIPLLGHHRRLAVIIGVFAAAFYGAIGSGQTVFFRYALPLVPLACLPAAVAVTRAGDWLAPRMRLPRITAIVIVTALVAAPSFTNSIQLDVLLARTDSRVLAAQWLAPQLNAESTLYDSGGDYTRLHFGPLAFHDWHYDETSRSFGDPEGRTPDWIVIGESPLREYTAAPPSIAALIAQRYELVHEVRGIGRESAGGIYDRQDAFFLPIAGFSDVARPGPDIRIYRRR